MKQPPPPIFILQYGHGWTPGGISNGDVCPAITTSAWQSNNFLMTPIMDEPKILTPQRTELAKQLRREGIDTFSCRESSPREDGISNTLTSVRKDNLLIEPNQGRTLKAESHDCGVVSDYRIRQLTPRECFRLMDVIDEDIDKIQDAGISNTAQYELAGNSIVVICLYLLLRNMFIPEFMAPPAPPPAKQLSLFDDVE